MRLQIIDPGLDGVAASLQRFRAFRAALWALGSLFLGLNLSVPAGLTFGLVACLTEAWTWAAGRPCRDGTAVSQLDRWITLGAVSAFALAVSALAALFWSVGTPALQLLASTVVFTSILHAHLFMSRSASAQLLASLGPIITLLTLLLFFGGFTGLDLVTLAVIPIVTFSYVIASGLDARRNALALEAARVDAVAASQAKSAFLAMMSHELRTPMNGVLGIAHALKKSRLSRGQAAQVDLLLQSGESLMTILGDILDVSKIEAGRLELETVAVDLPDLCELTLRPWSAVAAAKNVALVSEIDPAVPRWVMGDPTRLRQVVTNLVSNALKFTASGAVTLGLKPLNGAPDGYARLELSVSDSGIGLSEDQKARLFQPFVQAEPSTTRNYGGTGLGLNICKRLAAMMGGDISVESRIGEGSTFRVTLTLPVTAEPRTEAKDLADTFDISGLRILAVDDNETNRTVVTAVVGASGAHIETANDGFQALERLRKADFDVVLMDIHMPMMNGVEALQRIRNGDAGIRDTPVIALTADNMQGEAQRLIGLGFDAVQPKPVRPDGLFEAIAAAARPRSGREEEETKRIT